MRKVEWTQEIVPNGGIDETLSPTQIKDNKWSAAVNVEPLPDGARTRQGSTASNSVALQAIATSYDGGTDTRSFADTTSEYIAQGFQLTSNGTVSRVAVRIKITAGSPTGNVAAAIYDDSTGEPGSVVTGADFTDFSDITDSDITSEFVWYFFVLSTGVALTASTQYHLVIRHSGAAAGNTFGLQEVTTPSGYASGSVNYATTLGSWTNVAAADLNFRVYAGTAAITGIYDYWLSDGATQRHLVTHDAELYKNSGGTMTALSARERQAPATGQNVYPDFAVGNDRCFIARATDTPVKAYISGGAEYFENQGISAPTAVPTLAATAGGSLATGEWTVDYYYWNDDIGIPSNRKYQGVSSVVATTSGTDLSLVVTGLPTDVAREGDRATHVRVELKEPGGSLFYYAAQVALGTATVTITSAAGAVEAEYDHEVPPAHSINLVAENRQFFGGDASFPYRLWYSWITGTTAYYESVPTTNFRDFGKGDGDYMTALAFIPPRTLVVGFRNSIYAIDARDPGTSDVATIAKGIGIAGKNALIVVGRSMYFISNADKSKGPFVWNGQQVLPVLGIDDTFKSLNLGRIKYGSSAHLAPGDNRFQWWTLCSSSVSTNHDTILVYDYLLGAWTVYQYDADSNVLGEIETSSQTKIYMGMMNGIERLCDTGTQDNGTDITPVYFQGKAFDFGARGTLKRMRFVDYVAAEKTDGAMLLQIEADFGKRSSFSSTLDHMGSSSVLTWGTSAWGDGSVWGGGGTVSKRVGLRGVGKLLRPKVSGAKPFHLKGISFGVQPTGRR